MTDTKKERKARLKELEVLSAEADLEEQMLNLDVLRITRDSRVISHGPTTDIGKGVFRLESGVYDEVLTLASMVERWANAHPGEPIKLYIFSPGGSVFHGLALYDTLRTVAEGGHKVTTVIRGFAGSMASVIFLAGDERLIGEESIIHQHEPSSASWGKASDMADEAKFVQRLYDKMTRIYTERTGMTRSAFVAKTKKKEWYADSSEAIKLGVATGIG